MRPIWKGSINFGLVNIPVTLYTAVRPQEIKFRLLRDKDLSPIQYKKVAEVDGKEVPAKNIVKGFEHAKGEFVVITDEDFDSADIAATKTVTIESFADLADVNPLHFYKPYLMEPDKGADHAYVLLREALTATGKIGISRVVISSKQHLAAVRPQGEVLILELMHFAEDMVDPCEIRRPGPQALPKKEMDMAKMLVATMEEPWNADAFKNDYLAKMQRIIDQKVKTGGKTVKGRAPAAASTKVIDLMAALQESLKAGAGKKKSPAGGAKPSGRRKAG
jgi:DNA end-binding protein Ku